MDPMNNPTPNPMPNPEPTPMPNPEPVASPEPSPSLAPEPQSPSPAPSPVPPVNPMPASGVTPSFQPTDPIMRPEPAKAPDPIEEELKAPMKAADPVPGSIGSAVSGPNGDEPAPSAAMNFGPEPAAQTPSVPFNDPAAQPEMATDGSSVAKPKAKANKKTLIALIIVAAMVVIALVAVLVMQLVSGDNSSNSSNSSASNSSSVPNNSNNVPTNTDNGSDTNASDNTAPAATIEIACKASYEESGNTVNQNIDFRVENNKLTGAIVEVSITDASGNMDNTSQTLTFAEMMGDAALLEEDDAFLGTNGELLVPVNTLSAELESALNVGGEATYSCAVN